MTQEDKQLLLKDLCARLPYGVKASSPVSHLEINTIDGYFVDGDGRKMFHLSEPDFWQTVDNFQYYLRPMSSMTYEERQDARERFFNGSDHYDIDDIGEIYADTYQPYTTVYTLSFARLSGYIDWLNAHHFDYHGLIPMGLTLEAPEGMYKNE